MRILFVGNARSIHLVRWVGQLEGTGWDVHVFDCYDTPLNPAQKGMSAQVHSTAPDSKIGAIRRRYLSWRRRFIETDDRDDVYFARSRARSLAGLIDQLQPDIIHALSFVHGCCLVLEAAKISRECSKTRLIFSTWGHEFTYFARRPHFASRVESTLELFDCCVPDCQRDLRLAREAGFRGKIFGPFPGGGGYDVSACRSAVPSVAPSKRKSIAVKGYQHWYGNALLALDCLGRCSNELTGYKVEIYGASRIVRAAAQKLSGATGLEVSILPPCPHSDMLGLMGRARIDLAVNTGDGTPNTMLEAMTMGAFPIQSDTQSIKEWITHGNNGLLIRPTEAGTITQALLQALEHDELVDRAAVRNEQLMRERVDTSVILPRVLALYEETYAEL
jgi:glycosyltransferase involved in cell wall biosynthesis